MAVCPAAFIAEFVELPLYFSYGRSVIVFLIAFCAGRSGIRAYSVCVQMRAHAVVIMMTSGGAAATGTVMSPVAVCGHNKWRK